MLWSFSWFLVAPYIIKNHSKMFQDIDVIQCKRFIYFNWLQQEILAVYFKNMHLLDRLTCTSIFLDIKLSEGIEYKS